MRRISRATKLALAALYEMAHEVGAEPMPPTLHLRALLALLYLKSDRQDRSYAGLWEALTGEINSSQAAHLRGTNARMHWNGIARSLGVEPQAMTFEAEMRDLVRAHHAQQMPDARMRRLAAAAVKLGVLDREIVAAKGRPHGERAQQLVEERSRRGLSPDGKVC